MPRDQDRNEQFEWVNAWAASMTTGAAPVATTEPDISMPQQGADAPDMIMSDPAAAAVAPGPPQDQLALDVAEIEQARDSLAALPVGTFLARRRTQALTLVPSRTSDAVPVFVGG